MEKTVMITIKGTQKNLQGEVQTMEFVTKGTLKPYGKKIFVSYEESELTGTEGVTTTFEVDGSRVSMLRTGKLNAKMEFVEGSRTESLYAMDVGTLVLGITARRVEAKMDVNGGTICLEYTVELERQTIGFNTYDIRVKADEE
ncbi:MAG: DUF1934 domain-containing protein [Oscillospiraceae bacterium]|nr:DUF1934 domain-containing protein [Oscillospiraceae bacterium]